MVVLTDAPGTRRAAIGVLLGVPLLLTWLLLPPIDYLPPVKRDAIDGFFQFPPGMNVDAIESEVVQPMVQRLAPYMAGEKEPALKNYYILIFPGGGTIGVRPLDASKIGDLDRLVRDEITIGFPDLQVFSQQGNLFGGFGDGRNIEVRLQSADFDGLLRAAHAAQDVITAKLPGRRCGRSRTWNSPNRNCGWCRMTGASASRAGHVPTSRRSFVRSATASGSASISTVSAGLT